MRVRKLNQAGDWSFGSGRNSYLGGFEAIAQCVKTRLLSLRNDWFLDPNHGIPWLNYLGKNLDLRAMEVELKGMVLNTHGVHTLLDFDIKILENRRNVQITVRYLDIYGNEERVTADAINH